MNINKDEIKKRTRKEKSITSIYLSILHLSILSFSSNVDERISYEGWKKYRDERLVHGEREKERERMRVEIP